MEIILLESMWLVVWQRNKNLNKRQKRKGGKKKKKERQKERKNNGHTRNLLTLWNRFVGVQMPVSAW